MSSRLNHAFAGTLMALCLATTSVAVAQDATNTALARSLFEDGITHTEAGEWEQAADRFERSLALHASPVVSFNSGVALAHLGRLVEARERFRTAAGSDNARLTEAARAQIEELSPRIGSLEIEVRAPAPEGASVLLDGSALPEQALGVAIPVDPTSHTVQLVSDSGPRAEQTVTVAEGGSEHITLNLVPSPEQVANEALLPPLGGGEQVLDSDDTLLIATLTGAGVIVATIIVVVLVLAFSGNHPPIEGNLGIVELGQ